MADRVILAGLPFAAATAEELAAWIAARRRGTACATVVCASVDFVVRAARTPELAETLRQVTILTAAAQPIVWLSRLVGRGLPACVPGDELILNLAEQSVRMSTRLCLLGNTQARTQAAARALADRFPGLNIVAAETIADAATDQKRAELFDRLSRIEADVFVAAPSAPATAAHWIAQYADRLPAGACILLTEPSDLDRLAETLPAAAAVAPLARRFEHAHPPGRRRRALAELVAFAPVVLHEWTHLIGIREARLPARGDVIAAAPADPHPDFAPRVKLKRAILVAADMLMLATSFLSADWLRCRLWEHKPWPQPELNSAQQWYWYLWAIPVLMAVWPPILASVGLYRTAMPPSTWRWQRAAASGAMLFMIFSTLALFFSRLAYPRMLILGTTLFAPVGFVIGRFALVAAARTRRWFNDLGLPDYSSY